MYYNRFKNFGDIGKAFNELFDVSVFDPIFEKELSKSNTGSFNAGLEDLKKTVNSSVRTPNYQYSSGIKTNSNNIQFRYKEYENCVSKIFLLLPGVKKQNEKNVNVSVSKNSIKVNAKIHDEAVKIVTNLDSYELTIYEDFSNKEVNDISWNGNDVVVITLINKEEKGSSFSI